MEHLKKVSQCRAKKKDGGRCTRRTGKYGPFCWQHTQKHVGVEVKRSTIPNAGNGLFAKREFKRGELVRHQPHEGVAKKGTSSKFLSKRQIERKYPGEMLAPYGIQLSSNRFRDDCRTNAGVVRYANDKRRAASNNAVLTSTGNIRLKKGVKKGEEIFVSYGRGYWDSADRMTPAQKRASLQVCSKKRWPANVPTTLPPKKSRGRRAHGRNLKRG